MPSALPSEQAGYIELGWTPGQAAQRLFDFITVAPGFLVFLFVFKEKANANVLFLCSEGWEHTFYPF